MPANRRRRSSLSRSSSSMKRGYDVARQQHVSLGNKRRRSSSSAAFSQLGAHISRALKFAVLGIFLVGFVAAVIGGIWIFFAFSKSTLTENSVQNIVLFPSERNEQKNTFFIAQISPKDGAFRVAKFPITEPVEYSSLSPRTVATKWGVLTDEVWQIDSPAFFTVESPDQLAWQITQMQGQSAWTKRDRWWWWWQVRSLRPSRVTWTELETATLPTGIQKWLATVSPLADAASCSFSVLNTTSTGGVASKVARLLESNNIVVVRLADEMSGLTTSKFLIDAEFKENCAKVISRVTSALPENAEVSESAGIFQMYRSPLVILAGEDLK